MSSPIAKIVEDTLLKTKDRKMAVIVFVLVLGLILGGLFVIRPGLARIAKAGAEIKDLSQKESTYKAIMESEKKAESFKARFPQGDKTWLIEQLNSSASQSNVSISSTTPEDSKKPGGFLTYTSVRVDAEANYHQLGAFVARIENLSQFMKILALNVSVPTEAAALPGGPARKRNVYKIAMTVGLLTPAAA